MLFMFDEYLTNSLFHCRRDKKVVWPHWLMFALVCIKSISLVLISLEYHTMKIGAKSEGWAISFHVFTLQASLPITSLRL